MPPKKKDPFDLGSVLADIQKEQNLHVGGLRESIKPVRAYTTGDVVLDNVTGVGGFPIGRMTEVYGDFSSGKTTAAVQAARYLQRDIIRSGSNEKIVYMDHEHAMSSAYAESLGIDPDHCDEDGYKSFYIAQPSFMEQGADAALKLIKTGLVRMVIFDSVAEMVPEADDESDTGQRTAGMNRARILKDILLRMHGHINNKNVCAIFINHLQMSIPTGYGQIAKEKNPGGQSLPFHSSLRLRFVAGKKIKTEMFDPILNEKVPMITDVETTVTSTKNKMAHGYRSADLRINLGRGFDSTWSALQVLINYGNVVKSGSWYYMDPRGKEQPLHPAIPITGGGRPGFQGEPAMMEFSREHPDWAEQIKKMAASRLQGDDNALRYDGPVDEEGYDAPVVRKIPEVDSWTDGAV